MKLGTILGTRTLEEVEERERAELFRKIHDERVRRARANGKWEEIEDDLVRRGRKAAPVFVSAGSDRVYQRCRGIVFAPRSAEIIASEQPLYFTVHDDGLVFFELVERSWTARLERVAATKRQPARRPRRRPAA